MESFSFLKFWRTAAAVRDIGSEIDSVKKFADAEGNPAPMESTDEEIDNEEDSFFDLVFTSGINGDSKENNNSVSVNSSSVKQGKLNSPESPRDVFFTPNPISIDANSKPHSPNSVLPSSPKFSVCFLGFRKSKPEKVGIDNSSTVIPKIQTQKCKVEEDESSINDSSKQFARADMGKYLKLMKPLYSRASKRFTEKSHFSSSPSVQSLCSPRNSSEEKHGNRAAVLMAVRKRLGKSRSTASSFAGASTSPMTRRDDSLLEQNDGIQSAILHCKRSYSSARKDSSVLLSRNANEDKQSGSCEEQNRWSI